MEPLEQIYWEYKGMIELMEQYPATYSLDNKRAELHEELKKFFPGLEKELKEVLHNLPLNFSPDDLCWSVKDIVGFREYLEPPK